MFRPALLAVLILTPAARAQEAVEPFPWQPLPGVDAGAVGTCTFEGGEKSGCYMVRCANSHLQFAVRDPALSGFGVRSFSWQAGASSGRFSIRHEGDDLGVVDLATNPHLAEALVSGAAEMQLATDEADNSYSTTFELTGAAGAIEAVAGSCR